MDNKETRRIGSIGNYYGGLHVMKDNGKYYWCIENYDTDFNDLNDWEEITEMLYDVLDSYGKIK